MLKFIRLFISIGCTPPSAPSIDIQRSAGGPVLAQVPLQLIHQVMEPSGLADATRSALPQQRYLDSRRTDSAVGEPIVQNQQLTNQEEGPKRRVKHKADEIGLSLLLIWLSFPTVYKAQSEDGSDKLERLVLNGGQYSNIFFNKRKTIMGGCVRNTKKSWQPDSRQGTIG